MTTRRSVMYQSERSYRSAGMGLSPDPGRLDTRRRVRMCGQGSLAGGH
ncbi:hypothetical protein MX551_004754 [Salmonella enterica]|nr:hypothetical protein [Salmonella enterica]EDQ9400406.1 hypothetical protein [Salmonella enterica]EDR4378366.1 hypothetical protein [Salmonella enterica]EDU9900417.1 hypothetical protein [Salmonella enterica subsp. diarizonae]EEG5735519.1 hypothetical protein [Salmonella enterica]EEG6159366.1 hypothetical protein [Salmonella enterica]